MVLETKRLLLREMNIEDYDALFRVLGDPETAKVVFSAHYDTCARLPFPNFIAPKNLLVTLGYTLPKKFTDKIGIEGVRIYLTADNLWYTSARRGMDVRESFSGSNSYETYSAVRTVSGGITLSF